jgi:hypothetical protein
MRHHQTGNDQIHTVRIHGMHIQQHQTLFLFFAEDCSVPLSLLLTPTETRIFERLLAEPFLADKTLLTEHPQWTVRRIQRHMENIREKLRATEVPLALHRICDFGYLVLPVETA